MFWLWSIARSLSVLAPANGESWGKEAPWAMHRSQPLNTARRTHIHTHAHTSILVHSSTPEHTWWAGSTPTSCLVAACSASKCNASTGGATAGCGRLAGLRLGLEYRDLALCCFTSVCFSKNGLCAGLALRIPPWCVDDRRSGRRDRAGPPPMLPVKQTVCVCVSASSHAQGHTQVHAQPQAHTLAKSRTWSRSCVPLPCRGERGTSTATTTVP